MGCFKNAILPADSVNSAEPQHEIFANPSELFDVPRRDTGLTDFILRTNGFDSGTQVGEVCAFLGNLLKFCHLLT